eukprot:352980-Hanusia_phi.AAC.1
MINAVVRLRRTKLFESEHCGPGTGRILACRGARRTAAMRRWPPRPKFWQTWLRPRLRAQCRDRQLRTSRPAEGPAPGRTGVCAHCGRALFTESSSTEPIMLSDRTSDIG